MQKLTCTSGLHNRKFLVYANTNACAHRDRVTYTYTYNKLSTCTEHEFNPCKLNIVYYTNFKAFWITFCLMNSILLLPFLSCIWTSSLYYSRMTWMSFRKFACWLNFQEITEIPTSVNNPFHYVPNWFIFAINKLNIN